MGFMPFWQPSTLCFDAVSFHSCIVASWKMNLSLYSELSLILARYGRTNNALQLNTHELMFQLDKNIALWMH